VKVGASARGTGFRFPIHLEAKAVFPGHVSSKTPSLHIPLASCTRSPQKELIPSTGAPVLATFVQATPPDLVWKPARITNAAPQNYIFAYFKSCCLRVWLPISLKLGAE